MAKALVLQPGVTWKQISINPEDAEFFASRQFTVEKLARFFMEKRNLTTEQREFLRATFGRTDEQVDRIEADPKRRDVIEHAPEFFATKMIAECIETVDTRRRTRTINAWFGEQKLIGKQPQNLDDFPKKLFAFRIKDSSVNDSRL